MRPAAFEGNAVPEGLTYNNEDAAKAELVVKLDEQLRPTDVISSNDKGGSVRDNVRPILPFLNDLKPV